MAGLPAQAFTLSEIAQRTGTNFASCHAILNVLVQRGYLLRHPILKSYRLAPSIVAIGEAAAEHDGLLTSARNAAASLAADTGHETTLSARAGTDIIGVARFATASHAQPSLRVGQRVPMRPPMGSLFMAWTGAEDAERWIAPDGEATAPALRRAHEKALALVRERGFLVTLDSPAHTTFTREIVETSSADTAQVPKLSGLIAELDNGLYQPARIERRDSYPAKLLAAPIFDARGQVLYVVNINFASGTVDGGALLDLARELVDACVGAMQANGIGPDAAHT